MIHAMTEVFYRNGMLSSEEKDMIESDLDAAA